MADTTIKDEAIKYVAVEMINKDDKDASEVIAGLFKGIKTRKNDTLKQEETFILVHDEDKSTFMLNRDFHNIISIEVLHPSMRVMTYFMMGDEDQKAAGEILENLMTKLKEEKKVLSNDEGIVDINQYTDVPESIKKGVSAATKAGAATNPTSYNNRKVTGNTTVHNHNTTTYYKKKDPEPHLWKRRSKRPDNKSLLELAKKLDMLQEGKLKTNTPKLPGDVKKKATDSAAANNKTAGVPNNDIYNDDYHNYGCMC